MKNLKLSLMVVAMLVVATVANAQTSFGVKAGVNASNIYGSNVQDAKVKIGYHAGLAADFHFTPEVAIQTGLYASTKGYTAGTGDLKLTTNLVYIQLPVHLAYKVDVTPGTRIVFHGGPYAAYGVAGKYSLKSGSLDGSSDKVFGDGPGQLKPLDFGAGLGVGAEFGSFILDLGWDMGLVKLSKSSDGDLKNQNAYFSVGYKF